MNLSQLLKQRAAIIKEMLSLQNKITKFNSYRDGTNPTYDTNELLNEYIKQSGLLAQVRLKIHKANDAIIHLIIEQNEQKSLAKFLQGLPVTEGPQESFRTDKEITMKAQIQEKQRAEMLKNVETRIQQLQDEIDVYNYNTIIAE